MKTGVRDNKNNNKELIFLTYDGVLQCIYSSHSKEINLNMYSYYI